jgi:hypothetical protein
MIGLLCFVLAVLTSPFKSKLRLEAENAVLRHQLVVLRRKLRGRVQLTNSDRWFFIQLYRWFPSILQVLTIIRPETLVRWHQAGFRRYWRFKSRSLGGRPQIETDLRALIRQMSMENPLWGAPRIHGELLKLGFEVAQSSVAKYMAKRRWPPGQGWLTFLRNHAPDIAAMDKPNELSSAVLRQHLARIDDDRLKRVFAAAIEANQPKASLVGKPPKRDTGLWRGLSSRDKHLL